MRAPDALFTDLYELTMMQAYLKEGMLAPAVFSLFSRRLPPTRNYLIACGLETVLEAIENTTFDSDDLDYLSTLKLFEHEFLTYLRQFRFSGDIYAVAEGTPVFANEPILEVVAPLPEAQFFETLVMNQIQLQTLAASKAFRIMTAAGGRKVIDFGARRAQGTDAAIKAARAFHIVGVSATSNVAAGRAFGIPVAGTMGHSYIQAHDSEDEAFLHFSRFYPNTVLLIDTYDTLAATRTVIKQASKTGDSHRISAVRLDSGNLLTLSRAVRGMLDAAGFSGIEIVASGNLDEIEIDRLVTHGAPIDCFGVGTNMIVSTDAPALDIAYKLTEYDGVGRMKLSSGKATLPGRKQVFRSSKNGVFSGDTIAQADEKLPGVPILECVMKNGTRLPDRTRSLDAIKADASDNLACLPKELLSLKPASPPYPVEVSSVLQSYEREVRAAIQNQIRSPPSEA